jgi:hypothetical protein
MAILALGLLLALPAAAETSYGVDLADQVTVGGSSLDLVGTALRKVAIVKVYVAGLYLTEGGRSGEAVLAADEPRHAINHYLRGAGVDRICGGWEEGLEANTPNPSEAVVASFADLCDWMGDVEKNDRFEFSYVPGEGTTISRNGDELGSVEGKEFADALFACWIGPDPGPGEKFKMALLGK